MPGITESHIMFLEIEEILVGERFRKDPKDLEALARSIKDNGLIQPIVVTRYQTIDGMTYKLLAGGRRLQACRMLGHTTICCRVYKGEDLNPMIERIIELEENIRRENLTWQEEVAITEEIHRIYIEMHGKRYPGQQTTEGWTIGETAKVLGNTQAKTQYDLQIAEAVRLIPDLARCETKDEVMKTLKSSARKMDIMDRAQIAEDRIRTTSEEDSHTTLINAYIIGDFLVEGKKIRDCSVDLVESDPPYGIDLPHLRKVQSEKQGFVGNLVYDEYGEVRIKDYQPFLEASIRECSRVLVDGGWLIWWYATGYWGPEVLWSMEKNGLKPCRVPAVWYKGAARQGMSINPRIRLGSSYETFFYAYKGVDGQIVKQGRNNVFDFPATPQSGDRIHPAERPVEMIQEVLATFTVPGSTILSPFLGSGNTLLAASNLGMNAYGYDINKLYRDAFILKVGKAKPPDYKSY